MKIPLKKWVTTVILSTVLLCFSIPASAFRNSLGMDMVPIKGGIFVMGAESGRGGEDEMPAHEVTLSPFFISETEVTVAQWKAFCKGSDTRWNKWNDVTTYSPADTYPVCFVSWEDAQEFCAWLSTKEGRTYRLPTEAEWEFAARGGLQGKPFPWGDREPDGTQCNFADRLEFEKDKDVWADQNIADGYAYCAPARSYPPNGFGLYNMAGNLWEWCGDWYCATHYKESAAQDPNGPTSGRLRVIRGGAWCFYPDMLRVSNRYGVDPTLRSGFAGFRVVAVEE
jgi:formylglycine-generating enzyme required for sulfatase activity